MYKWYIQYLDGTLLGQYDDEGNERLFGSQPQENIDFLVWHNEEDNREAAVSMQTGMFYLNGALISPRAAKKERKFYPELWFRNIHVVSMGGGEIEGSPKQIKYVLGWRATIAGKEQKLYMVLDDNHNVTWERYIDGIEQPAKLVI